MDVVVVGATFVGSGFLSKEPCWAPCSAHSGARIKRGVVFSNFFLFRIGESECWAGEERRSGGKNQPEPVCRPAGEADLGQQAHETGAELDSSARCDTWVLALAHIRRLCRVDWRARCGLWDAGVLGHVRVL